MEEILESGDVREDLDLLFAALDLLEAMKAVPHAAASARTTPQVSFIVSRTARWIERGNSSPLRGEDVVDLLAGSADRRVVADLALGLADEFGRCGAGDLAEHHAIDE